MLGLIGKQTKVKSFVKAIVPGQNPYAVNLQPWDHIQEVEVSKRYPEGKKVLRAANQDEFKKILAASPSIDYIAELNPEQQEVAHKSLLANCEWYLKEHESKQVKTPVQPASDKTQSNSLTSVNK